MSTTARDQVLNQDSNKRGTLLNIYHERKRHSHLSEPQAGKASDLGWASGRHVLDFPVFGHDSPVFHWTMHCDQPVHARE